QRHRPPGGVDLGSPSDQTGHEDAGHAAVGRRSHCAGCLPREPAMSLLEQTWADKPGLFGALSTVNHKRVATRYIITTMLFFVLAGALAIIMRTQLARPDNDLVGPDAYNQLF